MRFYLCISSLVLCLCSTLPIATAASYYVDYAAGSDKADGLSEKNAWKHAPGDASATGNPKSTQLKGGDTVFFKGGVTYRGSLVYEYSGSKGQNIRLDGNSDGSYGKGPAILDGGKVIENWQRCSSAEDVKGNKHWKNIYYADVDIDISKNFTHGEVVSHRQVPRDKMAPWQRIILCDGTKRLLPIAQYPKAKDAFYPDLPGDFLKSAQRLSQVKKDGVSVITDPAQLKDKDKDYFEGMHIGVHGGNNHVYFAAVKEYDPEKAQLTIPFFKPKTYPDTRYAYYNSARLITEKGEWAVASIEGGKTRFFLWPDRLEDGKPANIGFPVLETGIKLAKGASHFEIDGFLIQRYSGGDGAVAIMRNPQRSSHVKVSNCEIRFLTGHAGIGPHYCDHIEIRNCYIHHCPGWTTAIFLSRVNDYSIKDCLLIKNSGSGIRHYESKRGHIANNAVLDHYGMHSSTINLYEGCEDILLEANYLNNIVTINRNAKKLTFRNNVIDSEKKSGINIAIWGSGRTGGRNVSDILIEQNTLINLNKSVSWGASVFVQGKASKPTGLVIRQNVLDALRPLSATVEGNVFINASDEKAMGQGAVVESNFEKIFEDPDKEDYRRKEGSVLDKVGANIAAPNREWQRK